MRLFKPRMNPIEQPDWSPEQTELMQPFILHGSNFRIFRTLVRHPASFAPFMAWTRHILGRNNTLSKRDREIAILRIGFLCKSGYEWAQHVEIGKQCGITGAEIEAIKAGGDAPNWTPAESALLDASDDLHNDKFIATPTWDRLRAHYSEAQVIDLIYTVGVYTTVSMALNSLGIQLDEHLTIDPDLDARAVQ